MDRPGVFVHAVALGFCEAGVENHAIGKTGAAGIPLVAFLGLRHFRIPLPGIVLGGTLGRRSRRHR